MSAEKQLSLLHQEIPRGLQRLRSHINQLIDVLDNVNNNTPPIRPRTIGALKFAVNNCHKRMNQISEYFQTIPSDHIQEFEPFMVVWEEMLNELQPFLASAEDLIESEFPKSSRNKKRSRRGVRIEESSSDTGDMHESKELLDSIEGAQLQKLDVDNALQDERRLGMKMIQRDLKQLSELYRDLGELIQEQGETIDTIEDCISQSKKLTEQAEEELIEAEGYSRSLFGKKFIATGAIIGAVAIAGPVAVGTGIATKVVAATAGAAIGGSVAKVIWG